VLVIDGVTVAQSGSIARYCAKLAGCYPDDPAKCAFNDAVFELGQEMCTINPLINCYAVGDQFNQVSRWYFSQLPAHLESLERQLLISTAQEDHSFFGGASPAHSDFNVYHHLSNAQLVEPSCVTSAPLEDWMESMEALHSMRAYLQERPSLVGIGTDPGLVDANGYFLSQRDPHGSAVLAGGVFSFEPSP
jgi:glutathione S-transferase